MSERRRARARWATATLAALAFTSAHVGARAAEPSDVESLRAAFTAAYEEESRGNVAAALAMFRAVQRERDTASVRYRVAACLDALARRPEALAAYRSVSEVARPGDAAVVESARARAQALVLELSELSVEIDGAAAGVVELSVDGKPVAVTNHRATLTLEPGSHSVAVRRGSEAPVPIHVTLSAGKPTVVVVGLRGERIERTRKAETGPAPTERGATSRASAALALGAGAALLAGCAVAVAVRESSISTIEETCPSGVCSRQSADAVDAAAGRARAMLPLAIATGAAGALALGAGTWLLLRPSADRTGRTTGLSAGVGGTF